MAKVLEVPSSTRTFRRGLRREAAIAALADAQHGVVALAQLRALGVTASAARNRVADGRLHRVHRGVYAVGRARLTGSGRYMAAVLACGPGAALSHRSAADHLGLLRSDRAGIDVTVSGQARRPRGAVQVHGSATLRENDVMVVEGVPCTSVARTLVDLGDVAARRGVERAVAQAEVLRVFDADAAADVLSRAGPRRGAGVLRAVLGARLEPSLTESDLEELMFAVCRSAGVPPPEPGGWITLGQGVAYKADFLWRAQRLVVETDGYASHSHRKAFEHDRRRDQLLKLAGWEVLRFTWREVEREPGHIARVVKGLLARLAGQ
jgi:predicted transcriptional regulator of viral defense system